MCAFPLAVCFWVAQHSSPSPAYITFQVVSSFGAYLVCLNIIMLADVGSSTLNVTGNRPSQSSMINDLLISIIIQSGSLFSLLFNQNDKLHSEKISSTYMFNPTIKYEITHLSEYHKYLLCRFISTVIQALCLHAELFYFKS